MTLDELLGEIADRGLAVVLVDGKLSLRGDKRAATQNLLAVLRWHRERVAERFAGKREKEWELGNGERYRAVAMDDDWHPLGAWCWRFVGEENWHLIKDVVEAKACTTNRWPN